MGCLVVSGVTVCSDWYFEFLVVLKLYWVPFWLGKLSSFDLTCSFNLFLFLVCFTLWSGLSWICLFLFGLMFLCWVCCWNDCRDCSYEMGCFHFSGSCFLFYQSDNEMLPWPNDEPGNLGRSQFWACLKTAMDSTACRIPVCFFFKFVFGSDFTIVESAFFFFFCCCCSDGEFSCRNPQDLWFLLNLFPKICVPHIRLAHAYRKLWVSLELALHKSAIC